MEVCRVSGGQPMHMQRAEMVLRDARHHLDLWLEVADARAPVASRLPRLRHLLASVEGALVLTHQDQADRQAMQAWQAVLPEPCFFVNARQAVPAALRRWLSERMGRPPLRIFVAGLPNVGKSTLINRLAGARVAPVGARAGVTRAETWVRRGDLAILDLPGILPRRPGLIAAALGLVPEGQYDPQEAALAVLGRLPAAADRYGIDVDRDATLEAVAESQHLYGKGGALDVQRAAAKVLQDLRSGRILPAQLEWPDAE